MHRSQFAGLIIDCQVRDLDVAARFWSAAPGLSIRETQSVEDAGYAVLDTRPADPHDIEAEVRRLETRGAKRVRAQRANFAADANLWND
jgi:hypothetical protein